MSGKILKVASNDLYGNVEDRIVRVYACFEHTKYMNNYVVFSIDGDNKKLCYGSLHLKDKSLVIFAVKDEVKKYILEFIDQYMSDKMKDFSIINLDNINKVEMVSYSEIEYDNLNLLDEKAIPKVAAVTNEEKEKKPIFMYLLIFLLVLFAIGLTILYFKPELFTIKYKGLECTNVEYDNKIKLDYVIEKNIVYDTDDKLESIDVVKTYTFEDDFSYNEFKNNQDQYFNNGEGYKYIDEELKFKLFYKEESIIDDYDEMLTYLKREGFSCVEKVYEK